MQAVKSIDEVITDLNAYFERALRIGAPAPVSASDAQRLLGHITVLTADRDYWRSFSEGMEENLQSEIDGGAEDRALLDRVRKDVFEIMLCSNTDDAMERVASLGKLLSRDASLPPRAERIDGGSNGPANTDKETP